MMQHNTYILFTGLVYIECISSCKYETFIFLKWLPAKKISLILTQELRKQQKNVPYLTFSVGGNTVYFRHNCPLETRKKFEGTTEFVFICFLIFTFCVHISFVSAFYLLLFLLSSSHSCLSPPSCLSFSILCASLCLFCSSELCWLPATCLGCSSCFAPGLSSLPPRRPFSLLINQFCFYSFHPASWV